MATTTTQAQGLVLALFGASAGGHLTGLAAASSLESLAGDLSTSAGMILGKDLSSNTAFRDHVTSNLKLTGDALTAANAWLDGQLNAGAARGDTLAAAVNFLSTLTDTTSPFYASAQAFQATVTAAVAWSTGAGATVLGVTALREQQGHTEVVVGSSFTLTTGADTVFGTAGDDTVTATDTTYTATDMIADSTATDNDTLTVTAATDVSATPTVLGIENVNFIASGMLSGGDTTFTVDVANVKGGANIDVSASNAETLIAAATVNNIATGSTVTTDSKMATVIAAIATDANVTINSDATAVSLSTTGASKNLTVSGAGDVTITASTAKGDVTVTGAAVDVTAGSTLTNVVVTASDTAVVTADAALGNVTVNATGDVTVSAAAAKGAIVVTSGEDIVDVDGAGAATSATLTAVGAIAATGDHAILSAAKALTASAGKASFIDADAAKSVTLTSTGTAEVVFTLAAAAVDTLALAGDSAINVVIETQDLDTETVTSTNTAGAVLTLKETVDLSAAADLSNVASNVSIRLGADFDGETLTLANEGAVVQLDAEVAQTAGSAKPVLAAKTSTSAATNSLTIQAADSVTTDALDDTANLAGLTVTSYGTVNLVAGTDAITSTGNIVGDELTSLVVTGTKAVSLAEVVGSATTAATVDASGLAANFTLTLNSTANGAEKVIGGSKVDTITISAAAASGNTFDISTGAGNDVFNVNAVVNLKIDGGAGTDTIVTAGDFSAKTLSLTSVESFKLTADTTLKGSYLLDKTFLIETDAGAVGDDLIVSVDAATTNLSTLAFASSMASSDLVKIDGSVLGAMAQTITGSSHNDVITGGSGADTITGGAGADTITGGAGADTITGGSGVDAYVFAGNAASLATASDVITDAQTTETFDFSAVVASDGSTAITVARVADQTGVITAATTSATITDGVVTGYVTGDGSGVAAAAATAYDTFAEVLAAVRASVDGAGELAKFTFGSDSYLFVENGTVDQLVKLTGVTVTAVAVASEVATITI